MDKLQSLILRNTKKVRRIKVISATAVTIYYQLKIN